MNAQTISLDLGCGKNPRNVFNADIVMGIDIRDDLDKNIKQADLVLEPIPFDDNYFNFVTAHDFIEHIPRVIYMPHRKQPFIDLMNEIYRVLVPGGLFFSITPAYPHPAAFYDPTHINYITKETFTLYFDNVNKWASIYGFNGSFKIIKSQLHNDSHLLSILQKEV